MENRFRPELLEKRSHSSAVRFNAFPAGRWEVVWLGDVAFHSRHSVYSQPTVSVVLRALDGEARSSVEVQVPVAQLFALHLGSIWQDKIRTQEQRAEVEQREITVAMSKATPCAVGVALEDELAGGFLLPFEHHPHHLGHTKGWCIRVDVGSEVFVFPALELIRFYFGSSGGLLKRVFSPNLTLDWLASERTLTNGLAKLVLDSAIPAASAADVARISFDPAALSAAMLVGRSLQAASSTGGLERLYPRTSFPFKGFARLNVAGHLIEPISQRPRFLVERIVSCSAPFPFTQLQYVSTNRAKAPTGQTVPDQAGSANGTGRARAYSAGPTTALANGEPKSTSALKLVPLERDVRFPDLLRKEVSRLNGDTPSQVLIADLPPSPFDSTGDGLASGKGRKSEIALGDDHRKRLWKFKCPVAAWAPFFDLLEKLATEPWTERLTFVQLDSRQVELHYSRLPQLIDEDGVLIEDSLPIGEERRLISLVNVQTATGKVALLSLCPCPGQPALALAWVDQAFQQSTALRLIVDVLGGQHKVRPSLSIDLSARPLQIAYTDISGQILDALAGKVSDGLRIAEPGIKLMDKPFVAKPVTAESNNLHHALDLESVLADFDFAEKQ